MEYKHHAKVKELVAIGKSTTEIAEIIGVSYSRAYQLKRKLERIQRKEEKYAK